MNHFGGATRRARSRADAISPAAGPTAGSAHGDPLRDRPALAWPEIGFPQTSIELPLPVAVTVERDSLSIWDAALSESREPSWAR